MPIAFLKIEQRILAYYFKVYEAFGCNKTFTSMMFQKIIDTKNPQEGIAKLRFAKLLEKSEQLNGKFGYKLLDIKKIVAKVTPDDAVKILNKFSKLQFVDTESFPYEVVKVFNGKGNKDNSLHQIIAYIPFKKYSKSDKAKIIAELFSTNYSNLELLDFAYKLLGCTDNIAEINTNTPILLSAVGRTKDSATVFSTEKCEDIAELFGIELQYTPTSCDRVISNFATDIMQTRDVEHLEETTKMFNKKAVCLTLASTTANGGQAHKLRQELVLNNHVEAVISLSKKTFFTKTLFAPVILVLNKEKDTEQIQFINATSEDDLPLAFEKILKTFAEKTEIAGFSRNVSALEVIKNDYYLEPTFYVKPEKPVIQIDLRKEVKSIENLEKERTEVASKLKEVLSQKTDSTKTVSLADICTLKKTRITKIDLENKADEDCILVYSSSVKADELGTPYYPLDNYKAGDYTKVMVKDDSVKKEYLYQVLASIDFKDYIASVMKGTVIKVVSTSDISKFTLTPPSPETQERIITLYKDLDKATNNLQATMKQMEVIKANLLSYITN